MLLMLTDALMWFYLSGFANFAIANIDVESPVNLNDMCISHAVRPSLKSQVQGGFTNSQPVEFYLC